MNLIWACVWPLIEPLFNNTEEDINNDDNMNKEYVINENQNSKNRLELAGDQYAKEDMNLNDGKLEYALWSSKKSIALYENAFLKN